MWPGHHITPGTRQPPSNGEPLGNADGLAIHSFPAGPEALGALKAGSIQPAIGVSPSTAVAMQFGVGFGPPQRIMVSKLSGVTDLSGLRDRLIRALDMTAPERTLRDEMTVRHISYALQAHSERGELDAAVAVRRCAAGVGKETRLARSRPNFPSRTSDFVFLPERLAIDPVVPAYRYNDQAFGLIVDWTIYALIEAEAQGITKDNVVEAAKREDMRTEQLLGHDFSSRGRAVRGRRRWSRAMASSVFFAATPIRSRSPATRCESA